MYIHLKIENLSFFNECCKVCLVKKFLFFQSIFDITVLMKYRKPTKSNTSSTLKESEGL